MTVEELIAVLQTIHPDHKQDVVIFNKKPIKSVHVLIAKEQGLHGEVAEEQFVELTVKDN